MKICNFVCNYVISCRTRMRRLCLGIGNSYRRDGRPFLHVVRKQFGTVNRFELICISVLHIGVKECILLYTSVFPSCIIIQLSLPTYTVPNVCFLSFFRMLHVVNRKGFVSLIHTAIVSLLVIHKPNMGSLNKRWQTSQSGKVL